MAKVNKNDRFCCAACGMEVVVNQACECVDPNLVCCGGPMKHKKFSAGRSGKAIAARKSTGETKSGAT